LAVALRLLKDTITLTCLQSFSKPLLVPYTFQVLIVAPTALTLIAVHTSTSAAAYRAILVRLFLTTVLVTSAS
jgi:hypothetical protein